MSWWGKPQALLSGLQTALAGYTPAPRPRDSKLLSPQGGQSLLIIARQWRLGVFDGFRLDSWRNCKHEKRIYLVNYFHIYFCYQHLYLTLYLFSGVQPLMQYPFYRVH